jgi:hypothetical protein
VERHPTPPLNNNLNTKNMKPRFSPAFLREQAIKDHNERAKKENEKFIKFFNKVATSNSKIEEYVTLLAKLKSNNIK